MLAAILAVAYGCAVSDMDAPFAAGDYRLNVTGKVVNKDTQDPISGIQVVLETHNLEIRGALTSPADTAYSAADGSFSLNISQKGASDSYYYRIKASDVDGSGNGGHFTAPPVDIYLVDGSVSYDSTTDTYKVSTNIEMSLSSSPL